MTVGLNSRPKEWSRPPEPHPPDAGRWCSRSKRRPYVSLIWCSTPSGHGNGLRPWIRNNHRRTAHEPVNLPLDCKHAHVSGHFTAPRPNWRGGDLSGRSIVKHSTVPQILQKSARIQYEQVLEPGWLELLVCYLQDLQIGPRLASQSRHVLAPQLRRTILVGHVCILSTM